VREGDHWQITEMLADGVIELAIICYPVIDSGLADVTPLLQFREKVIAMASKHHPLAKRSRITQDDILEQAQPFMLLRWWQATPMPIVTLAARAKYLSDLPMNTGRFLACDNLGIGFFTKMVILPDLEAGNVVELKVSDMPPIYRDTALVRLARNNEMSVSANNMVKILQAEARKQTILL
jgi:LysR family transcriptional regulator, low CO2-responsive transcriptional regulator